LILLPWFRDGAGNRCTLAPTRGRGPGFTGLGNTHLRGPKPGFWSASGKIRGSRGVFRPAGDYVGKGPGLSRRRGPNIGFLDSGGGTARTVNISSRAGSRKNKARGGLWGNPGQARIRGLLGTRETGGLVWEFTPVGGGWGPHDRRHGMAWGNCRPGKVWATGGGRMRGGGRTQKILLPSFCS